LASPGVPFVAGVYAVEVETVATSPV
jgi:hypothetical protein